MTYENILELAQEFESKATSVYTAPDTLKFHQQKELLSKFYDSFHRKMRTIINQLLGDLFVLTERNFDYNMTKILKKVILDLKRIMETTDTSRPYIAAGQLSSYVLDKPNKPIIDNLDYIIKNYLTNNPVVTKVTEGPILGRAKFHSIDDLRSLSKDVIHFMNKNPLILSGPESGGTLQEDIPRLLSGTDDKTNI